jgi:hypothetical protein
MAYNYEKDLDEILKGLELNEDGVGFKMPEDAVTNILLEFIARMEAKKVHLLEQLVNYELWNQKDL